MAFGHTLRRRYSRMAFGHTLRRRYSRMAFDHTLRARFWRKLLRQSESGSTLHLVEGFRRDDRKEGGCAEALAALLARIEMRKRSVGHDADFAIRDGIEDEIADVAITTPCKAVVEQFVDSHRPTHLHSPRASAIERRPLESHVATVPIG